MRYATLFSLPVVMLFVAASTSAQELVPINITYPETESVLYAPAVEAEAAATSLAPIEAEYASTAPSLTEPYYTSSPAAAGCAACGCSPCACAPCGCAEYRPCAACGTATIYQPVVTFRPVATPYRVGHGIIGQPKLYVDGQPIRNTLRFFTP